MLHYMGKKGKGPQCGDSGCKRRLHGVSNCPARSPGVARACMLGGVASPRGQRTACRALPQDFPSPSPLPHTRTLMPRGRGCMRGFPKACGSPLHPPADPGHAAGRVQPRLQAPEECLSCLWRLALRLLRAPAVRPLQLLPPLACRTPHQPYARTSETGALTLSATLSQQDRARFPH